VIGAGSRRQSPTPP